MSRAKLSRIRPVKLSRIRSCHIHYAKRQKAELSPSIIVEGQTYLFSHAIRVSFKYHLGR